MLKVLHWFPIDTCIAYNIILISFKCIDGLVPVYLKDLLTFSLPFILQCDDQMLLLIMP